MRDASRVRGRARRWSGALLSVVLAACAGPVPSGSAPASPEASVAGVASPSVLPQPTAAPSSNDSPSPAPTPTVEPPSSPEPPPDDALPLRTEVRVNRNVVDRPGVPADLAGLYWWTDYGDAGEIATTAQIGLPAEEEILTVAEGLVVSSRREGRGFYARVDLLVRDVRTGELVRKIETDIGAPRAVILDRRLFWHGADPRTRAGHLHIDGGVWTASVDGDDKPYPIIAGGADLSSLGSGGRSILRASPSGRTLASDAGGFQGRFTDFIDVQALSVRGRIEGKAAYALTDDTFATLDGPPSDTPDFKGLSGFDILTGERLWRFPDPGAVDRFSMANIQALGSGFAFQYIWHARPDDQYRFESVEFRTGKSEWRFVQTITRERGPRYATFAASTARHLAVIQDLASIGALLVDGPVAVSIYNTETGRLVEDAFTVDPPWLCFEDRCLDFDELDVD